MPLRRSRTRTWGSARPAPEVDVLVDLLDCTVMPYAWGSHSAIAELTGRTSPSPGPEAELWMGAHPMAPARVARLGTSLVEVIAAAPEAALGPEVAAAFGPRLPFLLKV